MEAQGSHTLAHLAVVQHMLRGSWWSPDCRRPWAVAYTLSYFAIERKQKVGKSQERESKLVGQLKQRLQPYVEGQEELFLRSMAEEADNLNESAFGGPMLKTIGWGPQLMPLNLTRYFLSVLPFSTPLQYSLALQQSHFRHNRGPHSRT